MIIMIFLFDPINISFNFNFDVFYNNQPIEVKMVKFLFESPLIT